MPNIARPVRRAFIGDLIPATSWGSSLANILTKSCWDRVKELPISYAGNVCLMCGYFSENRRRDAHELWGYKDPMQEGTFGKQTLKALMPLCTDCHETFHLGFANVQGRLDIVLRYYRSLTGPSFTAKDIDDYYRWIGDRWTLRSNFFWGLDVSIISDRFTKIDPLILKKEWVLQDTKIIISEEKDSQTVFAGVHWKNAGADTQVNYLPASELD